MVINPAIAYRCQGLNKKATYEEILKQATDIIKKEGVTEESKVKLRALDVVGDSRKQIAEMIKEWESKKVAK